MKGEELSRLKHILFPIGSSLINRKHSISIRFIFCNECVKIALRHHLTDLNGTARQTIDEDYMYCLWLVKSDLLNKIVYAIY